MDTVAGVMPRRNVFDLSHDRKFTCDMGYLIPCLVEEAIPADTFFIEPKFLARLSPQTVPFMHRVNIMLEYFFVPTRLIWKSWENFITGGVDGDDETVSPFVDGGNYNVGTLADYMGIPTGAEVGAPISVLPFRAYNLIWDEWYRDQNFQDKVSQSSADYDGDEDDMPPDGITNKDLLKRNWEKDYFTSALPWQQRGEQVALPLGTTAPVSVADTQRTIYGPVKVNTGPTYGVEILGSKYNQVWPGTTHAAEVADNQVYAESDMTARTLTGTADLSEATAASINDLRAAFQIQLFMERNARAGVRLVEFTLAHFGVRPPDFRMQRPEHLGGVKVPLTITEVLQTSETADTPQGNMAGHGAAVNLDGKVKFSVPEHGYIIGMFSVMPRTAYQQGLPRKFSRNTRYDYYFPEFAHLGEQAVLNKEIYAADDGDNDLVFGYQGRYDEFRRRESSVHGDMRTTMNDWHLGRIFESRPELNSAFITADPSDRSSAVPSVQQVIVQLHQTIKAIRPLPLIGEPGLIDHSR